MTCVLAHPDLCRKLQLRPERSENLGRFNSQPTAPLRTVTDPISYTAGVQQQLTPLVDWAEQQFEGVGL